MQIKGTKVRYDLLSTIFINEIWNENKKSTSSRDILKSCYEMHFTFLVFKKKVKGLVEHLGNILLYFLPFLRVRWEDQYHSYIFKYEDRTGRQLAHHAFIMP